MRPEPTGSDLVTWGEFVETRLLSEYREAGAPVIRMRPAIEELRSRLGTLYPLATARPFVSGRELVQEVQREVGLDRELHIVVIRSGQVELTPAARRFVQSVEFGRNDSEEVVERVHPLPDLRLVVMDPLRQFGEPVVRSVPTEVIAEQVRAGDPIEMIARLYELDQREVEAAVRYELLRAKATLEPAA